MFVAMAELVRPVGLRGELRALLLDDFLEAVLSTPFARLARPGQPPIEARLDGHRWQGQLLVVKLRGVDDRTGAEQSVGARLGFSADDYDGDDFPRPEQPLPFVYRGLRVLTEDGREVGTVAQVLAMPSSLVLRVERPGASEALVPVVPELVPRVDRAHGLVVVRAIPGLLDGEAWIDESE